jgi:hypothetical protein
MRQRRVEDDDTTDMPGQDSFLDIIANIVGILILLVMIVGVRAAMIGRQSATPVVSEVSPPTVTDEELQDAERALVAARDELIESAVRIRHLMGRNELRSKEREVLADYSAQFEQSLADRRDRLSEGQKRDFDLRRQLAETQEELDELSRRQIALQSETPQREELKNKPTPISRTVNEEEVVVRIKHGRVSVVPLFELKEAFDRQDLRRLASLAGREDAYGTVGPINGYRMHYRIFEYRVKLPGGGSVMAPFPYCEYKPIAEVVGEELSQAMAEHSQLSTLLSQKNSRRTVVTLCVYPDSFSEFHELREHLNNLGFTTAARPLHAESEIASSPFGSKSAVQ